MDKEQVSKIVLGEKYYSVEDLRYNQKVGIMLSKEQFFKFLSLKEKLAEENEYVKILPLKTFNSKHCFYVNGLYLNLTKNEYLEILISDLELNQSLLFDRNVEDILNSRLFSEIEGTLNIENVPTTHKRIAEIHESDDLTDKNDIIIKNMFNAVDYIMSEKPSFNRENLRTLYNILSKDCLDEKLKLKEGMYYRDDDVYVGDYQGASPEIIEECMDSLFAFANEEENIEKHGSYLPYICHYYILYVHPYFDYNGRTARMVSFWLNYINNITSAPYFMSEAINENKSEYYRAITNTRNTNNDLTYFLGYILETSIKYSIVYKNLEEIRKELSKTGDTLTSGEFVYLKKILIHNSDNYFNPKMFIGYINSNITRQGAVKILNKLNRYGILEKAKNKKGEIIYKVNQELITYKYNV